MGVDCWLLDDIWHDNPPAGDGALGAGCSGCENSRIIDIFLRKEETSAMISAMRNSITESSATARANIMTGRDARAFCNQSGFPRAGEKFLLESAVTN